jgi:hypothetical protein
MSRLEVLGKPFRRAIELKACPMEKQREIVMQAFAETVIRGWEVYDAETKSWKSGIENLAGDIVPVTPSVVLEVLKAIPDLYNKMEGDAGDSANYRQHEQEQDAKN